MEDLKRALRLVRLRKMAAGSVQDSLASDVDEELRKAVAQMPRVGASDAERGASSRDSATAAPAAHRGEPAPDVREPTRVRRPLGIRVVAKERWHERLEILIEFLEQASSQSLDHRAIDELNEVLAKLEEYFPARPETWAAVSHALCDHFPLVADGIDIDGLYRRHLGTAPSSLMTSIWKPWWDLADAGSALGAEIESGGTGRPTSRLLWRGVALLYRYAALPDRNEGDLWTARRFITASETRLTRARDEFSWGRLVENARDWIATRAGEGDDVVDAVRALTVAGDIREVSPDDLENYLSRQSMIPPAAIHHLREALAARADSRLYLQFYRAFARSHRLTNRMIGDVFATASAMDDSDLAWRAASILKSRQRLGGRVAVAWDVSGEARADYPVQAIGRNHLEWILAEREGPVAGVLRSLIDLGQKLQQILEILGDAPDSQRVAQAPGSLTAIDARAARAVQLMGWATAPRTLLTMVGASSERAPVIPRQCPPLVLVLPENLWTETLMAVLHGLGGAAWGWRLSAVVSRIHRLTPNLTQRTRLPGNPKKVRKWLAQLLPTERTRWQRLIVDGKVLGDDAFMEGALGIAACFAIAMHPDNVAALSSLHTMRVPLSVLRTAEEFILSDVYSRIRSVVHAGSRVGVPDHLRREDPVAIVT